MITDSCFISNNEYVSKYQRCIDSVYAASCTGGNLCINYFDFLFSVTPASSTSVEINNSEFWQGVSGIEPEQPLGFGLTIVFGVVNSNLWNVKNKATVPREYVKNLRSNK